MPSVSKPSNTESGRRYKLVDIDTLDTPLFTGDVFCELRLKAKMQLGLCRKFYFLTGGWIGPSALKLLHFVDHADAWKEEASVGFRFSCNDARKLIKYQLNRVFGNRRVLRQLLA